MKMSKYERYRQLYSNLTDELDKLESSEVSKITDAWNISFKQMDDELSKPKPAITKSMMVRAMESSLMDTYFMMSDLSELNRCKAISLFSNVSSIHNIDVLDKIDKKFSLVINRGKIVNENEYYLIRNKVDEFELDENENIELAQCQKLLDDFELS